MIEPDVKALRARAEMVVEAYDAWSVQSYPSNGTPPRFAQAWFDEAKSVDEAIEGLRNALEEFNHGD